MSSRLRMLCEERLIRTTAHGATSSFLGSATQVDSENVQPARPYRAGSEHTDVG